MLSGILHAKDCLLSFESMVSSAERHKAHRVLIRGCLETKQARRLARAERQRDMKLAYAESVGIDILDVYKPAASSLLYCELGVKWMNKGKWISEDARTGFLAFAGQRDRKLAEKVLAEKQLVRLRTDIRICESRYQSIHFVDLLISK